MIPSLIDAPAEPGAPEAPGFARLARLLGAARGLDGDVARKRMARVVRVAINSSAFERATLNGVVPPTLRLARLAALQKAVAKTDLLARDREEAIVDLDRAGCRVLWAERIVEIVIESEAQAVTRAAALLSLVARGIIPAGAAARALLEPAKSLLLSPEARFALAASPKLKTQMIDLLTAAQAGGPMDEAA
jgi:hypothetical protein